MPSVSAPHTCGKSLTRKHDTGFDPRDPAGHSRRGPIACSAKTAVTGTVASSARRGAAARALGVSAISLLELAVLFGEGSKRALVRIEDMLFKMSWPVLR